MKINHVKDKFLQKNIKKKGLRIPRLVDVSVSSAMGKLRLKETALKQPKQHSKNYGPKREEERKREGRGKGKKKEEGKGLI